ncbi:radical SAM protein [Candidatus Bathyarchaeota archaeon]|nr:MAG: radical SAM protein [Candidatus Bathyarchaeota archaeon]
MKVLLVNPPKSLDGREISREECGIGAVPKGFLPSQPLLSTNYLRNNGIDADFVDAETSNVSFEGYDVVVVWVSVLKTFYKDIKLLEKAKKEGKKTVMVLNEPYFGFEVETLTKFSFIDASIKLWEREIVLHRLICKWEKNEHPDFPGVVYRKNGKIVDNGFFPPQPTLEHLSSCSKLLESLPLEKYTCVGITTGRGCPLGCTFCLYRRIKTRKRKIQDVISEFEVISPSIKRVLILDPALLFSRKWTENFCDQLKTKRIRVFWRADIRPEQCTMERLNKIYDAGCDCVLMAIEALIPEIRRKIMAGTTPENLKQAIKNLKKIGINPIPIFDVGYLWDTEKTYLKILDVLKEISVPYFELNFVKPWKGTPYYEECLKLGVLKRELTIDDYVYSYGPMIDGLYLKKEDMEAWKKRIIRSISLNPRYILNFLRKEKKLKLQHLKTGINLLIGKI